MDEFADMIGNKASLEDYTKMAMYFESEGNHFRAGQFFLRGLHHSKV